MVWRSRGQIIEGDLQGDVVPDGGQHLRQAGLVGIGPQRLPPLAAVDQVPPFEDILETAEALHQFGGGLLADPGDAGNVVGGIAGQAEEVRHALGGHPEALEDLRRTGALFLHGIEEADPLADDLHQILVAGDHGDLHPLGGMAAGDRGDHVIGFKTGDFHYRDVQGPDHLPDVGDLSGEIVRHRRPVGLVIRIEA